MKLSFLFTILVPVISLAQVQFDTGNRLKAECDSENLESWGYCIGYIIGVADANNNYICAPDGSHGATKGQFESIVKKYLVENPAQLHKAADVIVLKALTEAFPCKKK